MKAQTGTVIALLIFKLHNFIADTCLYIENSLYSLYMKSLHPDNYDLY